PPPTHTYTLSLHDALPISREHSKSAPYPNPTHEEKHEHDNRRSPAHDAIRRTRHGELHGPRHRRPERDHRDGYARRCTRWRRGQDRKSTRLNSSHVAISYA